MSIPYAPNSKYKAVIFDFDDTLFESRAVKWAHHKAVQKKHYGKELTDEELRMHWGKPLPKLIEDMYKGLDTHDSVMANLVAVKDDFRKIVYPDALFVIGTLKNAGMVLGIISAASSTFVTEDLLLAGFSLEDFICIQCAEDSEFHKPDPRVFDPALAILSAHGIGASDCVYVGDSVDDVRAAHGAGIDCIALTTGLYDKESFTELGARVIVSNLTEASQSILGRIDLA